VVWTTPTALPRSAPATDTAAQSVTVPLSGLPLNSATSSAGARPSLNAVVMAYQGPPAGARGATSPPSEKPAACGVCATKGVAEVPAPCARAALARQSPATGPSRAG
jgi:hypothetical protein